MSVAGFFIPLAIALLLRLIGNKLVPLPDSLRCI